MVNQRSKIDDVSKETAFYDTFCNTIYMNENRTKRITPSYERRSHFTRLSFYHKNDIFTLL
ncbi:MAG: hypothetical protein K940chlam2_01360 [Chlamydiae bacterium]|nr:hypothetical protein [Chlamydiota bacterium]